MVSFLAEAPSFYHESDRAGTSIPGLLRRLHVLVLRVPLGGFVAADGEDIYDIDYEREMKSAMHAGDYSTMVRLIYLRTLRTLDEEGRIVWRIYKTPTEYAAELRQPAFATMTRHFLRVRYGRFGASEALCEEMRALQAEVEKGGEA